MSLPITSVSFEDDKFFIYKKLGEKFSKQKILIGLSSYNYIEILSGITYEDYVVLNYLEFDDGSSKW